MNKVAAPQLRLGKPLLIGLTLAIAFLWIGPAQAQHIDYILGTGGLLMVQQAPPGIYFNNQPSYFFAGSSSALKSLNINAGLDVFLDLTTIGWTTPLTVLGANYGMNVTIPLVHTNGSLDLSTDNNPFQVGRSKSALGTSSIYVEPINFGWHTPVFDAITSFGFFAPAGSYNPNMLVNTGLGRWAEMFSLGGTGYSDPQRTWSIALEWRYLTHQSQQGIDLRAGDDFVLEGGAGRKFDTVIGQVNVGLVGYWQITDTSGSAVRPVLQGVRANVYALGPEVAATTEYGRYYLRFLSEFGAAKTPQGHEIVAGVALAF